jgi:hypothetical protein
MIALRCIVVVSLLVASVQADTEGHPELSIRHSSRDKRYGTKGLHADLHMVGFQGQPFSIATESGSMYSLLSMPSLYMNARMIDMTTAEHCVAESTSHAMPDRVVGECLSYPGTYMTQIGLVTGDDRIVIEAAPRGQPLQVMLNGAPFEWSRLTISVSNGTLEFDAHMYALTFTSKDLRITIRNVDRYVTVSVDILRTEWLEQGRRSNIAKNENSRYANDVAASKLPVMAHGLLGQTMTYTIYPGGAVIQGDASQYTVKSILSHQFAYSLYGDSNEMASIQYPH